LGVISVVFKTSETTLDSSVTLDIGWDDQAKSAGRAKRQRMVNDKATTMKRLRLGGLLNHGR
jgi:hypothetical protein